MHVRILSIINVAYISLKMAMFLMFVNFNTFGCSFPYKSQYKRNRTNTFYD